MKDFIISTDSTADLPAAYIEENKIAIHPLHYILDGVEYGAEMKDLPIEEFYQSMRDGVMPTTSATNPEYIKSLMKKQTDEGFDVLHIGFSSGLSCSYNNARLSAEEIMEENPDAHIIVVDSLCATAGQGLMVYRAVEMKKMGKSMQEIADWINENRTHIVHQFIVQDLFHLVRGGRLKKSAAVLGSALNIQPLLHVDDEGKLSSIGKVRGRKKALNTLAEQIEDKTEGIGVDAVFITHADCLSDAQYLADKVKERYQVDNIVISQMCPTIGTHAGIGAVLIAYYGKER